MEYNQKVIEIANDIATNCLSFEAEKCFAKCPMKVDIASFVNEIGEVKEEEAMKELRDKLFIPATLGRICSRPCAKICSRNKSFNHSYSIGNLEKYIADNFDDEAIWDLDKKKRTNKKVCVIGCGPAGAQAAINLAKEGHSVTIIEKLDVLGGKIRVLIPEFKLPRKIIDFEFSYLEMLGIEIKKGIEVGKDISFDTLYKQYDCIILANGTWKSKICDVKGKDANGVYNSVSYLKDIKKYSPKKTVVIGSGNAAVDCARSSVRLSSSDITIVALEQDGFLKASYDQLSFTRNEGVKFECGYGLKEVLTDENNNVVGAVLVECTSVFDENNEFNPTYGEQTKILECDTLVIAIGEDVEDITDGKLLLDKDKRYNCDKKTLKTSLEKVFVCGDNCGSDDVVNALALGVKASISANNFLKGQQLEHNRNFDDEVLITYKVRRKLEKDKPFELKMRLLNELNFDEVNTLYNKEEAIRIAKKCLHCQCKKCMDECIMLSQYIKYPKDLFSKFIETGEFDPLIAYSCNLCKQCSVVCPNKFDFAEFFKGIREDFAKANNGKSPMKDHKSIDMHQRLSFSKMFTVRVKGKLKKK